jgi:hypothetical protein
MNRFSFARTFAILLILSLLVGVVPVRAASNAKSPGAKPGPAEPGTASAGPPPAIEIPEVKYDFGELFEEAEVSHDFAVRNKGRGPLNIDRVPTS